MSSATKQVAAFVFVLLCACSACANTASTDGFGARVEALAREYARALAQGDPEPVLSLHVAPNAVTRERVEQELAAVHDRYADVEAQARVLIGAQYEGRGLLRWSLQVTGRLMRGDGTRYLIRDGVRDSLLGQGGDGWGFGNAEWPQADAAGEVRNVLAAAQALEGPLVVDCVLRRQGGRWRPLRPMLWAGGIAGETEGEGDLAAAIRDAGEALNSAEARGDRGELHLFVERRGRSWRPPEMLWRPATDERADARLERLAAEVEQSFADAERHEALAEAYLEAEVFDWALEEYEKAASLAPTVERAARVQQVREYARATPDHADFGLDLTASRRLVRRMRALARSATTAGASRPAQLLLSEAALVRLSPGEPRARSVLAGVESANRRLTREFGFDVAPVEVSVFANQAQYLAYRLSRGDTGVPTWSGGTSGPDGILTYSRPGVEASIAHEYAHTSVDQVTGGATIPKWVAEGFATLMEGAPPDFEAELERVYREGAAVPLGDLCFGWSRLPERAAAAAYVESRGAVAYVLEVYGTDRFRTLLKAFPRTRTFDEAFRAVLGVTMAELYAAWVEQRWAAGSGVGGA